MVAAARALPSFPQNTGILTSHTQVSENFVPFAFTQQLANTVAIMWQKLCCTLMCIQPPRKNNLTFIHLHKQRLSKTDLCISSIQNNLHSDYLVSERTIMKFHLTLPTALWDRWKRNSETLDICPIIALFVSEPGLEVLRLQVVSITALMLCLSCLNPSDMW